MKIAVVVSMIVLATGCAARSGSTAATDPDKAPMVAEEDLNKALAGRVAGPPQECVDEPGLGGNQSYGRGAILFGDTTEKVVYVNRPPAGCPEIDSMRAIRASSSSTRLCRGYIITVFDPVTRMSYGTCTLGPFTPYVRTDKPAPSGTGY